MLFQNYSNAVITVVVYTIILSLFHRRSRRAFFSGHENNTYTKHSSAVAASSHSNRYSIVEDEDTSTQKREIEVQRAFMKMHTKLQPEVSRHFRLLAVAIAQH